jgi:hypothetical protein
MIDKFTTPEEKAQASGFIQNLRDGQLDVIEARIDPELRRPGLRDTFEAMRKLIPSGEPDSVQLVGAQTNIQNSVRTVNLTFEYQFGEEWLLINCATRAAGEQVTIVGLNVHVLTESLEKQNRFTLVGKSPLQYTVLAAMVLAAGLSLFALVACARHKGLRRKWAWVLFILFGFGILSVNWSTGAWVIKPLYFQLFSAGASSSPYGPWELSVAVPLGALIYLFNRGRNQTAAAESKPEPIS